MVAQAGQDQLTHADDRRCAAGRHIEPAEKFLPRGLYRACQRPVACIARGVGIGACGRCKRRLVRRKGLIQPLQHREAVVVEAQIPLYDPACQSRSGGFAMNRDQVVALGDQGIYPPACRRAIKIGPSQVHQGAQHLTDTHTGHIVSCFPAGRWLPSIGVSYRSEITVSFRFAVVGPNPTIRPSILNGQLISIFWTLS